MLWGLLFVPRRCPSGQDPQIQVRSGLILTLVSGGLGARGRAGGQPQDREGDDRERRPWSTSGRSTRQGQSSVFVDLYETIKNAEPIWQDLNNKLEAITDLPVRSPASPSEAEAQQGLRRYRRD